MCPGTSGRRKTSGRGDAYIVENAATGCSFRASIEDSFNTVISLVLLPATPFAQGGRDVTLRRAADNLYLQFQEQGAFDPSTTCGAG